MPPQNPEPKIDDVNKVAEALRSANNILVTVSSNPSIDQLAACIGLTLVLNKMEKHGTAVFSGRVPSVLEFLKPEETLEKNTNSLRDFIISLDKSKADKLRYKVEDDVVKIFITPYRTSITEKDFDFSQGDFNVEVVVALGVNQKTDLDKAITSHGRILHDATVISVNTGAVAAEQLGAVQWNSADSSSLCEMITDLATELDASVLDNQIATALLTGIVVETGRFSNEKSSPHTMQVAGKLMESGASTQLITTKLDEKPTASKPLANDEKAAEAGVLEIEHKDGEKPKPQQPPTEIPPVAPPQPQTSVEEKPKTDTPTEQQPQSTSVTGGSSFVAEPPTMGGRWTANDIPEHQQYSDTTDPLSQADNPSIIDRPKPNKEPTSAAKPDDLDAKTLHDIEKSVQSPHLDTPQDNTTDVQANQEESVPPPPPLDDARNAVEQATGSGYDPNRPDPLQALNAQEFNTTSTNQTEQNDKPPSSSPPPPVPPPMMPPGA